MKKMKKELSNKELLRMSSKFLRDALDAGILLDAAIEMANETGIPVSQIMKSVKRSVKRNS